MRASVRACVRTRSCMRLRELVRACTHVCVCVRLRVRACVRACVHAHMTCAFALCVSVGERLGEFAYAPMQVSIRAQLRSSLHGIQSPSRVAQEVRFEMHTNA
eukprot:6205074-Pleurochrysis_carterae.AAC.2